MKDLTKRTAFAGTFGAGGLFRVIEIRIVFRQVRIVYRRAITITILNNDRLHGDIGALRHIEQRAFEIFHIRAIGCCSFGKNIQWPIDCRDFTLHLGQDFSRM